MEQKNTAATTSDRPAEPDWAKNAVLYQVNTRNFSEAGNFAAVEAELPRLKALGIDVVWLMPVHPIGKERGKGSLGSPYSVRDYFAVHPDYGTLDDFKRLVQATHSQGMKLILDWVPNHTAWDAVWKAEHPEYYSRYNGDFTVPINEKGEPITDWSDVCDLDYAKPETRRAMIGAMQFWLRECDIDGFRVDMAGLVPNDFWAEARPALDSVKVPFMLAEWQDEPGHFQSAFNANYGWKWKDVTRGIANGKMNAHNLDSLLQELDQFYPKDYYQLYFTQNHDENTWHGTEADLLGAATDAMDVLMFTWQGMPMLYNGMEDVLTQRLKFFDRDPILWKKYERTEFFQKLCDLRHKNQALWSGKHGGKIMKIKTNDDQNVYAFTRSKGADRVIVVLNLSGKNQSAALQLSKDLTGHYANTFGNSTLEVTNEMNLNLKPWEYLVLSNK
jgi:alpha-amylase